MLDNVPVEAIDWKVYLNDSVAVTILEEFPEEVDIRFGDIPDFEIFWNYLKNNPENFVCSCSDFWAILYDKYNLTDAKLKTYIHEYVRQYGKEEAAMLVQTIRDGSPKFYTALEQALIDNGVQPVYEDEDLDESYRSRKFRASRKINENRASRRSFRRNRRR